jgi:hypothetical protein
MAKITKVPNGPLIKKSGPFKGSTLKSGGKIKKAQGGMGSMMGMMGGGGGSGDDDKKKAEAQAKANANMIKGAIGNARSLYQNQQKLNAKSGGKIKKAKSGAASTTTTKTTNPIGVKLLQEGKNYKAQVTKNVGGKNATYEGVSTNMNFAQELANKKALTTPGDSLRTVRKNGGMLKRADMKKKLTSAKTAKDPQSRINKSLRKWNC